MSTALPHILFALQRFQAGGAERQVLYLAKGFMQRGYPVTVLAFGEEEGLAWDRFRMEGIRILTTQFPEKILLRPRPGITGRYLKWKYERRLVSLVRSLKPEIILPFTYAPNVIYGRLWRKMGAKRCFWNQRDEGRWFEGGEQDSNALRNSTGIISNSLEGKLFIQRYTETPVSVVHNGVRLPTVLAHPAAAGRVKAVMVANLKKYKDHHTLLQAWKILHNNGELNGVELVLAGRDGDQSAELKKFVQENGLMQSVNFAGQVKDVDALLAVCHIGVFSSYTEGLPNGVLECMAVGLPVVATRITGTQEALGEDYPFLAEPKNPDDFAHQVSLLIHDPKLREETGKKNRKRAEQLFGIDRMVNEYLKIIS
jgi:glycosyltransferase involved in cell wall biosynthesis